MDPSKRIDFANQLVTFMIFLIDSTTRLEVVINCGFILAYIFFRAIALNTESAIWILESFTNISAIIISKKCSAHSLEWMGNHLLQPCNAIALRVLHSNLGQVLMEWDSLKVQ